MYMYPSSTGIRFHHFPLFTPEVCEAVSEDIQRSALNKEYDHVRQIARLKQYGCAMVCDTFLVLCIFLDKELAVYINRQPANLDKSA